MSRVNAFDWYMVPHHALQGTARASHYHVLSNDAKLSADKLQRFTFDLCHVYGRATKIVSRPAHVYYAHLAAFNGPFYSSDFRDTAGADWCEVGSVGSHGSSQSATCGALHPSLADTVYYA